MKEIKELYNKYQVIADRNIVAQSVCYNDSLAVSRGNKAAETRAFNKLARAIEARGLRVNDILPKLLQGKI